MRKGCGQCVESSSCVYCPDSDQCVPGDSLGPKDNASCPKWRWKQCVTSGSVVWIIVGSVAGFIALIVVGCLCYCMCFSGKKRLSDVETDYVPFYDDDPTKAAPKTAKNRKKFQEKYGIGKTKDNNIN